ncbi:MAG: hypothetical protein KGH69_01510 [Candidatus Micrarchaeota archaeon]|nr:hypothetical protein [Candidatus Micrarchaeota archaeon]
MLKLYAILAGLLCLAQVASAQYKLNISPAANWSAIAAIFPPQTAGSIRFNYADAAILPLGNGTYRMYYSNFTEPTGQYNTQGSSGTIDSATTRDGIHWSADNGARATNQGFPCPPWQGSVMRLQNGTIRLYSGCGIFQSNGGLNFSRTNKQVQMQLPAGKKSVGAPQVLLLNNGTFKAYWAYFVSGSSPIDGRTQVISYSSADGFIFTQDPGIRIGSNLSIAGYAISGESHPLVYELQNDTWVMYLDTGLVKVQHPTIGGLSNPSLVATSKDGMNWSLERFAVDSSEIYGFVNGNVMIFGYYGQPQFQLPSYSMYYGGGLYYAKPNEQPQTTTVNQSATSAASTVYTTAITTVQTTTISQDNSGTQAGQPSIIDKIVTFFKNLFGLK